MAPAAICSASHRFFDIQHPTWTLLHTKPHGEAYLAKLAGSQGDVEAFAVLDAIDSLKCILCMGHKHEFGIDTIWRACTSRLHTDPAQ
jgi:hypothetical protein